VVAGGGVAAGIVDAGTPMSHIVPYFDAAEHVMAVKALYFCECDARGGLWEGVPG